MEQLLRLRDNINQSGHPRRPAQATGAAALRQPAVGAQRLHPTSRHLPAAVAHPPPAQRVWYLRVTSASSKSKVQSSRQRMTGQHTATDCMEQYVTPLSTTRDVGLHHLQLQRRLREAQDDCATAVRRDLGAGRGLGGGGRMPCGVLSCGRVQWRRGWSLPRVAG